MDKQLEHEMELGLRRSYVGNPMHRHMLLY